jgi:very-short-patch-repair endonuclease
MGKGKLAKEVRQGLVARARKMRTDPTPEEASLWQSLRKCQLGGYKFRRQHVIGAYIVDFYCPQARMVVEVDGKVHANQIGYDRSILISNWY